MASSNLSTYAPNSVIVTIIFGDVVHNISGYSEDSIVTIARNSETFGMYTGADDTNTRIYNANTSGTISIPLQQTSNSNDFLMQLYLNDVATRDSSGLFQLQVKDTSGRSLYFTDQAYIGVVPDSSFANSMQLREWVIHAPRLQSYVGGNSKFDPADATAITSLGATIAPEWL
jgi:hypothetical protein